MGIVVVVSMNKGMVIWLYGYMAKMAKMAKILGIFNFRHFRHFFF